MPLRTTQPTIYSIEPRIFLERDLTNAILQTSGTQELSLVNIRKGTSVVDCWVDVVTAAGATSVGTLFNETGTTEIVILSVADANATGLTRGPITATGYDPITGDGDIKIRKTGTGTALVVSIMCSMVRPNMTP